MIHLSLLTINTLGFNCINQYMLILTSCVNLLDSQVLSTKNNDIQGYPSKFLIFGSSNTWPVVVFFLFFFLMACEYSGTWGEI